MGGVPLLRMRTSLATDVVYSLMVDDFHIAGSSRMQARKGADDQLEAITNQRLVRSAVEAVTGDATGVVAPSPRPAPGRTPEDIERMRKTWGLLPEHQAGLARAISMFPANEAAESVEGESA